MLIHERHCVRAFARAPMAIQKSSLLQFPFFADLVVIARSLYPIPSRTRPSKSSAPMVLSLKAWKSRSLPGLQRTEHPLTIFKQKSPAVSAGLFCFAKRVSILGIPWVAGTTRIGVRPDRGCGRHCADAARPREAD